MFCGECGTANPDTNQFCKNCGKPLKKRQPQGAPLEYAPVPQPAVTPLSPVLPVAPVQTPGSTAPGKSMVSIVLGIISILLAGVSWFLFPYITAILAIILGITGIIKAPEKKSFPVILAILGILVAFIAIIVDIFYLNLFPVPPII